VSTVLSDFTGKVERELERHGWCERGPYDSDGRICLVVAISQVLAAGADELPLHCTESPGWHLNNMASEVAASLFPGRGDHAYEVNDHPDTTREDISLILKHLQARLDEETA
jgi:hypothetical protein